MSRRYDNDSPITDMFEAMEILCCDSHRTSTFLHSAPREEPIIERQHFGGHYDRYHDSTFWRILATTCRELQDCGFVEASEFFPFRWEVTPRGRAWHDDAWRARHAPPA